MYEILYALFVYSSQRIIEDMNVAYERHFYPRLDHYATCHPRETQSSMSYAAP